MSPAPDRDGPTGITFRRARPADAAAVADVYLASFHGTYDFPLAQSDDAVRGWVRDVVVHTQETWVAVDGDGTVLAMMVVGPNALDHLYVSPRSLGQGIGTGLLDLAKRRSPSGLELYTFQSNTRARRFYERNGFRLVDEDDGSRNEERQPDVRYAWRP